MTQTLPGPTCWLTLVVLGDSEESGLLHTALEPRKWLAASAPVCSKPLACHLHLLFSGRRGVRDACMLPRSQTRIRTGSSALGCSAGRLIAPVRKLTGDEGPFSVHSPPAFSFHILPLGGRRWAGSQLSKRLVPAPQLALDSDVARKTQPLDHVIPAL